MKQQDAAEVVSCLRWSKSIHLQPLKLCPLRTAAVPEPSRTQHVHYRLTFYLIDLPCFQKTVDICVAVALLSHAIYMAHLKSSDIPLSMFLFEIRWAPRLMPNPAFIPPSARVFFFSSGASVPQCCLRSEGLLLLLTRFHLLCFDSLSSAGKEGWGREWRNVERVLEQVDDLTKRTNFTKHERSVHAC